MTLKLDNSIPKDPYTKQLCVLTSCFDKSFSSIFFKSNPLDNVTQFASTSNLTQVHTSDYVVAINI